MVNFVQVFVASFPHSCTAKKDPNPYAPERPDHCPRRSGTQPQKHRRRNPPGQAGGLHRAVRLRQIVACLRHDLCRRAAPLCRIAFGLRAAVPRADGEAGHRPHRRALAGDLDRSEGHQPQSALDRRHRHRDLRLSAPALSRGSGIRTARIAAGRSASRPSQQMAEHDPWPCRTAPGS